jgi:hypothetical protein
MATKAFILIEIDFQPHTIDRDDPLKSVMLEDTRRLLNQILDCQATLRLKSLNALETSRFKGSEQH